MDLLMQKEIQLKFVLNFARSQFLKNGNFFNGKLSKNILLLRFFYYIYGRSFKKTEQNIDEQNKEMKKIKDELVNLQQ